MPSTYVVQILQGRFEPAQIEVHPEDSIVWRNDDSVGHSATADNGAFDTGIIPPGQIAGKVIVQPAGGIPYHDSSGGYAGQIVVTSAKKEEK